MCIRVLFYRQPLAQFAICITELKEAENNLVSVQLYKYNSANIVKSAVFVLCLLDVALPNKYSLQVFARYFIVSSKNPYVSE